MKKYIEQILRSMLAGIGLAVVVILLHKLCWNLFSDTWIAAPTTILLFGILQTCALKSKNILCLLCKGVTALFLMFVIEIFLLTIFPNYASEIDEAVCWFQIYIYALLGSIIGVVLSSILTIKKINLQFFKEGISMQSITKKKLLIYLLVTAVTYTYLVLPERAGISVVLFSLIQLVCLWFCVPNRKRLWLYPVIFLLSCGAFLNANPIWRIPNLILCPVFASILFLDFSIRDTAFAFLKKICCQLYEPLRYLRLPFQWGINLNQEKAPVVKRTIRAIIITVPCLILLIAMLSAADMVFSAETGKILKEIYQTISLNTICKIIMGILAGLYLFGTVYTAYLPKKATAQTETKYKQGDLIIINVLLSSILVIYTVFVIIQFRYLFAGSTALPHNLSYTEYARKGFFELLALTGINIALILSVIHLTKTYTAKQKWYTVALCLYLCAVTFVLLASSLYRMWLYSEDDGLTRLRFMVFGFLLFEAVGLIATLFYVVKPKFNIISIYCMIGVIYYVVLNIVPMDYIIAENQVQKYIRGERNDIFYVGTLSCDAVSPIYDLLVQQEDPELKTEGILCISSIMDEEPIPDRWQRFNLSRYKAEKYIRPILTETQHQ